jgi:uncharacterized protein DUF222
MPAEAVPENPGRDGDPARPDQDPMTAADHEAWLDHLSELDEPPEEEEEEYFEPLTPGELEEVRAAAADESLAVEAAMTGRRGPGMAGSARVFPGEWAGPAACEEFAAAELAAALGEGRGRAGELLGCAWELATRLPGTAVALRDGVISRSKADIILRAAQFLDEAEAAAAEGKVLGRAGRIRHLAAAHPRGTDRT